ncbi:MAG: DUF2934 domain-containing protein [Candidatus Omnitrophica bacterium]|nr:DUF2934 domain-containing protein [Candidatus Omnitrophota bacterium]
MGTHLGFQQRRQPSWLVRHREVSCIAHALYEQRGRMPGNDVDDWFKAEALLREANQRSYFDLLNGVN